VNTRRLILIAYALASVLIGVAAGQRFFRLFDQVVPQAVTTTFNRAAAHGYFLMNGALLGVVIALWGLVAYWLARMTGDKNPSAGKPAN
jgi:hypothetical protein